MSKPAQLGAIKRSRRALSAMLEARRPEGGLARIGRIVAAVAVALGGYLHYRVWSQGYRHAPVRELFLANAVVSLFVAIGLLTRWRGGLVAGTALSALSLIAFALSRTVGLPTLHGTFTEIGLEPADLRFLSMPDALVVLIAEGVATVICVLLTTHEWARLRGRRLG